MIHLNLTEEEIMLLKDLIETCLSDLREEIHSTDNLDYKEMLKKRKEIVVKLQQALATE
jgi:hypothetical protein